MNPIFSFICAWGHVLLLIKCAFESLMFLCIGSMLLRSLSFWSRLFDDLKNLEIFNELTFQLSHMLINPKECLLHIDRSPPAKSPQYMIPFEKKSLQMHFLHAGSRQNAKMLTCNARINATHTNTIYHKLIQYLFITYI